MVPIFWMGEKLQPAETQEYTRIVAQMNWANYAKLEKLAGGADTETTGLLPMESLIGEIDDAVSPTPNYFVYAAPT